MNKEYTATREILRSIELARYGQNPDVRRFLEVYLPRLSRNVLNDIESLQQAGCEREFIPQLIETGIMDDLESIWDIA